jgi:hypothetical protein
MQTQQWFKAVVWVLADPFGWKWLGMVFVFSRLWVALAAHLGQQWLSFPETTTGLYRTNPDVPLLDAAARWDSGFYLEIAQFGYRMSLGETSSVAFFPLYPLVLAWLQPLFGNAVLGGVVLSNLCFFGGLCFVFSLAGQRLGVRAAKGAVLMLCFFPTSFFFSAVYTESMFFLFSAMFFYALHKKLIPLAALAALFACATRFIGLLLCLVLLLEVWRNPKQWFFGFFPATAIGFYGVFLGQMFGDFFAFWTVQPAFGRSGFNPLAAIWRDIQPLLAGKFAWNVILDLGSLGLMCSLLPSLWRLQSSYALYAALSLFLPLLSGTGSLSRYALLVVPMMLLGNRFGVVGLVFSVGLLFILTMLFSTWHFVA